MANKRPLVTGGSTGMQELPDADTVAVVGGLAVGQSAAPDASAVLEADSTTKGFLLPRMTNTQRNAISSPATGLLIFNTDIGGIEKYNGTRWQRETQSTGTPSASIGSGWGTGASISIAGDDLAFKVTITSGTGSLTMTTIGTITFSTTLASGSDYAVFIHPADNDARGANMNLTIATTKAAGSFVLDINNTNITTRISNSTAYELYVHVIQYT